MTGLLNAFTTGNPFWGDILLGINSGRGFWTLKGLNPESSACHSCFAIRFWVFPFVGHGIFHLCALFCLLKSVFGSGAELRRRGISAQCWCASIVARERQHAVGILRQCRLSSAGCRSSAGKISWHGREWPIAAVRGVVPVAAVMLFLFLLACIGTTEGAMHNTHRLLRWWL